MKTSICSSLALVPLAIAFGQLPEPRFDAVTIDDKIQIGYGVAVADVDGDKRPDILLADKKQFVWYRNPGSEKAGAPGAWQKFVIAENLTEKDNVCIAAQDIDGDGKCELAVGAEWNPGDTVNSGAVFYMIAPADRTQRWTPVKLHAEPTTHRMRWNKPDSDGWGLIVVPLHGRGNKNGEGVGVKVLLYRPPSQLNDPNGEWKTELIDDSMHMTHNLAAHGNVIDLAGKEGVRAFAVRERRWIQDAGRTPSPPKAAGEVRSGYVPLSKSGLLAAFATVEPMHGNALALCISPRPDSAEWKRVVLTEKLTEGHALGFANLLGDDAFEIVVGWRGSSAERKPGIALWSALDPQGEKWRESAIDDGGMACEDLTLADLDGDGKLDIVASGRATKNVKVYFNRTPKAQ